MPLDELGSRATELARKEAEADRFLKLAQAGDVGLQGPDAKLWMQRLKAEHSGLMATLGRFIEQGPTDEGLRMAAALYGFWRDAGLSSEGREWFAKLLAAPGSQRPSVARANATHAAGNLAFQEGDDDSARRLFEDCLTLSQGLGYPKGIARACVGIGRLALRRGDHAEVRRLYETSLKIFRELGDDPGIGLSLNQLGEDARLEGENDRARTYYNESLELYRQLGNGIGTSIALSNLGYVETNAGNPHLAKSHFFGCLKIASEFGNQYVIPSGLLGLGAVAVAEGKFERAARLLGATDTQLEATGYVLDPGDRPEYERSMASARSALGDAAFSAAYAKGRSMSTTPAVEFAMRDER